MSDDGKNGAKVGSFVLNTDVLGVFYHINGLPTSYALSGTAADLLQDWLISAGSESVVSSTTAATLLRTALLPASGEAVAVTDPTTTVLLATRYLAVLGTAYAVAEGIEVKLLRDGKISPEQGDYAVTGIAADLLQTRFVAAGGNSYATTFETYTGLYLIAPRRPTQRANGERQDAVITHNYTRSARSSGNVNHRR